MNNLPAGRKLCFPDIARAYWQYLCIPYQFLEDCCCSAIPIFETLGENIYLYVRVYSKWCFDG